MNQAFHVQNKAEDISFNEEDSGELTVSGDTADLESDDDTLENSHAMGLRLDEDEENPKPLNIARDVALAEASRRGLPDEYLDSEEV